jgi:hypothetical protein
MLIDLDNPPPATWDLNFRFRGVVYPTRPLRHRELLDIQQLLNAKPLKPAPLRKAFDAIFGKEKPDVAMMPVETLVAALVPVMMEYFRFVTSITLNAANAKKFGQ